MATMSISPSAVSPSAVNSGAVSRSRSRAAQAQRPARLTRRGRLLLTAAIVGVLAAGWSGLHSSAQAESPMQRIEVKSGDTLWSIAQRLAPGQDPRATVYELRAVNHLDSAQLQPGQILLAR